MCKSDQQLKGVQSLHTFSWVMSVERMSPLRPSARSLLMMSEIVDKYHLVS